MLYKLKPKDVKKAKQHRSRFPEAKNARELAFLILYEVYALGAYSDNAINRNLNQSNLEQSEKNLANFWVYSCLERTIALDEIIRKLSNTKIEKLDKRVLVILRLGLMQIYFTDTEDYAAVNETVDLSKRFGVSSAKSLVNAILRNALRKIDPKTYEPKSIFAKTGFNQELYEHFLAELGSRKAVLELADYFYKEQDLSLRVRKTSKAKVKAKLEALGYKVKEASFQDDVLRLDLSSKSLHDLKLWQDGFVLAQGESAILAAKVLEAKANEKILDICAAPGGKTFQLYDLSQGQAKIYANDLHEYRVKLIETEAERLGISEENLSYLNLDAANKKLWSDYTEKFDRILIDAPCSALGLIQSTPEIRFNFSKKSVNELKETQAKILDTAANLLKPGGKLVYSTCTLNQAENSGQVENFLNKHEEFSLSSNLYTEASKAALDNLLELDPELEDSIKQAQISLWPDKVKAEGFFVSSLEKR